MSVWVFLLLHELEHQNTNPPRLILYSLRYKRVDIYISGILTVANLTRHIRSILVGWGTN
jgi:hypothetical protein